MTRLMRHPWHLIWIVIAYIPFLNRYSVPLTGDQKVYLSIAMEMRERGEWLMPWLFDEPSYLKPPFQYWMTLIGWKIFGFGMVGALLPSVIATVLTAWILGELSHELHGRRALIHAGVLFAGMIGTMTFGTTAQMEIWTALFYTASWWMAMKFLTPDLERRNWNWIWGAFAVAGLAALIKSPLYSVFWVSSFFLFCLISGEWELFAKKKLYQALALGTALGSIWYAYIIWADPQRFWNQYFSQETFAKVNGNGGPWYTIWIAMLYYCLPFTLMILPAIRAARSGGRRAWKLFHFLIAWILPPALFFTFYPYRIKPYAFILVPAVTLAIDWGLVHLVRTERLVRWIAVTAAVLLLICVAGIFLSLRFPLFEWSQGVGFAVSFAAIGFLAVLAGYRASIQNLIAASLSLVLVVRTIAVFLGEMEVRELKHWAQNEGRDQKLAMLDSDRNVWHEVGLVSLVVERPIRRLMDWNSARDWLLQKNALLMTEEQAGKYPEFKLLAPQSMVWQRLRPRSRDLWKKLILGNSEINPDDLVRRDPLVWSEATRPPDLLDRK